MSVRCCSGSITANHVGTEIGKFFDALGRAGVIGANTATLGREAECNRYIERFERAHLTVEPCFGVGAQAVGPAQAGANIFHTEVAHPADGIVEPRVLKMKPLTNAERGR